MPTEQTEQAVPDYEALIKKHTQHLVLKWMEPLSKDERKVKTRRLQIQDTIRAACTEAISLHKQWAFIECKRILETDHGSDNGSKSQASEELHTSAEKQDSNVEGHKALL